MKTLNCVLVLGLLFLFGIDLWAIPAGFNIQGRLTDANGINKNETFSIKFSVFATVTGGSPVWEQTQSVLVQNGNFQVILQGQGDISVQSVQLESAVKDLEAAYVEIKVGSEQPLVPRQPLLRSPFSSADKFTGAVMFFAGPTCPAGWELANGRILDTTAADAIKYADLINYLGTAYDPNHTQHMLPDMIDGSFIRGTGGYSAELGVKQVDSFQGHYHNFNSADSDGVRPDMPMNSVGGTPGTIQVAGGSQYTVYGSRYITNPRADANGNGAPRTGPETRPRNYSMTPCIKY